MALIAPLDPLRYDPALYPKVLAPPYDVIDARLRAELASRHPQNVVHLDLPEGDGDQRYENARRLFSDWQRSGVLSRGGKPSFWRYAQTFEPPGGGARLTRKGFFALVRAVPYSTGIILPHERTLKGPKLDRLKLSRATRALLSPGFMLYSDPERVLDPALDSGEPFAEFSTPDGIEHRIWRVSAPETVSRITDAFASAQLMIADGHHRYETALGLSEEIDRDAGSPSELAEHHFFPVLLANGDDPSLVVFPTHRLIHSLAHFDFGELVARSGDLFATCPATGSTEDLAGVLESAPQSAFLAVAPGGGAVLFSPRKDIDLGAHPVLGKRPPSVRGTGVALLHDGILEHLLGISAEAQAMKTNIRYLQIARDGIDSLERGEAQVLFVMKATPISVIRAVVEAGEVMPQKSTFFYPKVPTGLFFHTLDPSRTLARIPAATDDLDATQHRR